MPPTGWGGTEGLRGDGAKVIRLFAAGSKFRCYNVGNMSPMPAVIDEQTGLASFKLAINMSEKKKDTVLSVDEKK